MRKFLVGLILILAPTATLADIVVPSDRVEVGVNVREGASTNTSAIELLEPGESLEYVGSVPYWHEIRLPDGRQGYVSKAWTNVLAEGVAGSFQLYAADVGTGLGLLVLGDDFALVYDGGSNDDLARGEENRFVAFLQAAAPDLSVIDHLILSHPHRDHVELLPDMLAEYEVHHVWDSGRVHDICGYRAFLTAVKAEPTSIYHSARSNYGTHTASFGPKRCYGDDLPAEEITLVHARRIDDDPVPLGPSTSITFLHADGAHHSSPNENSVVTRLDLGTTRVLLMGDAEAGGRAHPSDPPSQDSIEGALLSCCTPDLKADILVAGHHGSKTSSRTAFLDAVKADTFIVSSGPQRYGPVTLPDEEVVDELEARGDVLRTDLNDTTCGNNPDKIGPDADDEPGGCDNVRVAIEPASEPIAGYWRVGD